MKDGREIKIQQQLIRKRKIDKKERKIKIKKGRGRKNKLKFLIIEVRFKDWKKKCQKKERRA